MKQIMQIGCALCLSLGLWLGGTSPVFAQEDPTGASYIAPFVDGDTYKLQVVGDQLAEGALSGILDAFGSDSRLQINRKYRQFAGLARAEAEDDIKAIEDTPARDQSHITIVMLGRDDRMSIRLAANRRAAVGSEEWREIYGRRADRLMKALKKRGGAVYWIGLPVMQRVEWNDTIQLINDLVRDRASLNGIKYIDAYAGFADENGSFIALGPDTGGLVRRLREGDGIGFTPAGNRKLAHFVEREIRRDLTQAKNERSIPLAGAEAEQRKISPLKAETSAATAAAASSAPKPGEAKSAWAATTTTAPQPQPSAGPAGQEQKADSSRIALRTMTANGREETVNIDIIRPAIPASVIQLISRNASPEKATQVGDTLQDTLPGGLLLLSSVSPSGDGTSGGRRARLAPTQTAYFRVMVKGEQLPSKPGRADDFRWPRPDQMAEPVVAKPAATAPVSAPAATPVAPVAAPPKTVAPRAGGRPRPSTEPAGESQRQ